VQEASSFTRGGRWKGKGREEKGKEKGSKLVLVRSKGLKDAHMHCMHAGSIDTKPFPLTRFVWSLSLTGVPVSRGPDPDHQMLDALRRDAIRNQHHHSWTHGPLLIILFPESNRRTAVQAVSLESLVEAEVIPWMVFRLPKVQCAMSNLCCVCPAILPHTSHPEP
jgi:hypothetical protein